MDKDDINSKKEELFTKANGKIIKCKEKDNLTLNKASSNIPDNGKLTSIMDGEFYTQIRH